MPSSASILDGLRAIANAAVAIAVAWHAVVLAACVALGLGWRPSQRTAGALLAAPVASVSVAAFAYGNAFNGGAFAALAIAMVGLAARFDPGPVQRAETAPATAGIVLIAFAWLYPHFLEGRSPAVYVAAAPTGLIPCPTLSLIIGFTLLAGGFRSRGWSLLLAAAGLFYGLFGAFRLGVRLDIALVAGALCLPALLRHPAGRASSPRPVR
jgi:hypothetical protein